MQKRTAVLALLLIIIAASPVRAEVVRIAGAGGMIPLMSAVAQAYMQKHPQETVEVNQKSYGSEGGVMALTKGAIDIAMYAHSPEERDRKLPILAYEVAQVPGLFAVNSSIPVRGLTSRQICDIYDGKVTNWKQVGGPDTRIVVFTRPENESTKKAVREGVACFARLVEGQNALMVAKSPEMYAILLSTPNAIGMINTVALQDSKGKISALKLDGRSVPLTAPDKHWTINHRFHLLTGKKPSEATRRFLEFLNTAEGQAAIRKEKAFPVKLHL